MRNRRSWIGCCAGLMMWMSQAALSAEYWGMKFDGPTVTITLKLATPEAYEIKYCDYAYPEWQKVEGTFSGLANITLPATAEAYKFKVKASNSEEWETLAKAIRIPKLENHPLLAELAKVEGSLLQGHGEERTTIDPKALLGKPIYLYFSASWCGPCRTFTPKLTKIYMERQAAGKPMHVIFVSGDEASDFESYYAKMPWLAVRHDLAESIFQAFGVTSFPTLLVLNRFGSLVTDSGRVVIEHADDESLDITDHL